MAVVMALLLKFFIVEAYKIPTGSMQPTLIGDERSGVKDRILVDKLSYVLREPRRWEVAVFRYPLDRSKNFVKRIVGVGPEDFRIERGDLWHRRDESEEWRVIRRPRSVQQATWKRLDLERPEETSWRSLSPKSDWPMQGRSIRARGDGEVAFRGGRAAIVDRYLDGYAEVLADLLPRQHAGSGANLVGDLRIDGSVRALAGLVALSIELKEGERRYRFRIPGPAAPVDAKPEIAVRSYASFDQPYLGVAVGAEPYRLPVGREVRFAAQNLDDMLELEVGGDVIASLEVEPARDQNSAVSLKLEGEGADLDDLMVYRDIYYLAGGSDQVTIPAGHYYMMGDNTQDSSDSREWTFARFAMPGDDGGSTILRGNLRRGENPRTIGFGDPEGPRTLVRDEWGERIWFRVGAAEQISPEPAPFVAREMIQGKALAVFWPQDPRRGIFRLKWVN